MTITLDGLITIAVRHQFLSLTFLLFSWRPYWIWSRRRSASQNFPVDHDDVIKWKHFPCNWPFVLGIHRSRWIPNTKASDAELWRFLYLRLNKRLSKQPWGWWFETPSWSLWRHCYVWQNLIPWALSFQNIYISRFMSRRGVHEGLTKLTAYLVVAAIEQ